MKYRIALLLKPPIIDYCSQRLNVSSSNIEVTYFSYSTMEEFQQISQNICSSYDGIITSGPFPDTVLSYQDFARYISHSCFNIDIENTYRLILRELLIQPDLKVSDIGIDFLYNTEETLESVILNDNFPYITESLKDIYQTFDSYEKMEAHEIRMAKHYLHLLQSGKIKFVLTCSITVLDILTRQGYSCKYVFPSLNMIHQVINNLCHELDIQHMKGQGPAIIRIDLHPSLSTSNSFEIIEQNMELKKKLTDFIQLEGGDLTLRCNTNNYEIYSNQETIDKLTNHYTSCCLSKYIPDSLSGIVTIGYGLGSTFYEAHSHAVTASEYSLNSDNPFQEVYLLDTNEQLISLSKKSDTSYEKSIGISNSYLKSLSLESKLSVNTLLKIINVLKAEDSYEISSVELINHLNVSLRTANHYLSNLQKCGKASVIGVKRPNGRGRSINIYHMDIPYK